MGVTLPSRGCAVLVTSPRPLSLGCIVYQMAVTIPCREISRGKKKKCMWKPSEIVQIPILVSLWGHREQGKWPPGCREPGTRRGIGRCPGQPFTESGHFTGSDSPARQEATQSGGPPVPEPGNGNSPVNKGRSDSKHQPLAHKRGPFLALGFGAQGERSSPPTQAPSHRSRMGIL